MKGSILIQQAKLVLQQKWSYIFLLIEKHASITKEQIIAFDPIIHEKYIDLIYRDIERVNNNEPLGYILKYQDFWKHRFQVDENVLIPRADSEAIIEMALQLCQPHITKICDLGTGSGNLIISLLYEFPNAAGDAIDISQNALNVAKHNAKSLLVTDRLRFIKSNLFQNISKDTKYDLIISNPPYISIDELPSLEISVTKYEPTIAITDYQDGLTFYKRIAKEAKAFLQLSGILICEIGYTQYQKVLDIFEDNQWQYIGYNKDLNNIIRCLAFTI